MAHQHQTASGWSMGDAGSSIWENYNGGILVYGFKHNSGSGTQYAIDCRKLSPAKLDEFKDRLREVCRGGIFMDRLKKAAEEFGVEVVQVMTQLNDFPYSEVIHPLWREI